ncbi:acyltransferase family protein [Streptomyces sp. PA03-1a]|nr:acyltransferase family protein [Streptomyces sp. PA03-1a]
MPWWDNIRYFSGTLVVIGHASETVHTDGLRWLWLATWALRVPVFVMVAGYFASGGPVTPRELRRLTESIVVPYVAVSLLHTLQTWYMHGDVHIWLLQPAWAMWFLLSLIFWRLVLPYVVILRHPLLLACVVALLVGYIADFGQDYSASRTVTYFPFFILGWMIRQGFLRDVLDARWSRWPAVAVLVLTFGAGWGLRDKVARGWLGMAVPYAQNDLPVDLMWGWAVRAAVLLAAMVIGLSLIRLVPRGRIPVVSYLGSGGLYIYLFHPLLIRAMRRSIGTDWVGPWHEQLALVVMAVLATALLASKPVRWLTRPLIQPRLAWLFTAEARATGAARAPEQATTMVGPREPVPGGALVHSGGGAGEAGR